MTTNPWNSDVPFSYGEMWLAASQCNAAIRQRVSHGQDMDWLDYAISAYMPDALSTSSDTRRSPESYRCLILGSNEGHIERRLCQLGFVGEIVASDIAERALARAREESQSRGFSNVKHIWADLNSARFEGPFDFIIAEGVLHHIVELEPCLRMLCDALTDDGLMFAVEFVGPVRFQLSELQVSWINAALAVLPMGLRPLSDDEDPSYPASPSFRGRVYYVPPTEESIASFDPSEAISGPEVKRLIPQIFTVRERIGFGGTLLSYMTGHFDFARTSSDPAAAVWLGALMNIERAAIDSGILDDEFVFYVLSR